MAKALDELTRANPYSLPIFKQCDNAVCRLIEEGQLSDDTRFVIEMFLDCIYELECKTKQCTIGYHEYLASEHWKRRSAEAKRQAGYKCQLCGQDHERLNTHHNNYKNIGHENASDLIVLCEPCHKKFHGKGAA